MVSFCSKEVGNGFVVSSCRPWLNKDPMLVGTFGLSSCPWNTTGDSVEDDNETFSSVVCGPRVGLPEDGVYL